MTKKLALTIALGLIIGLAVAAFSVYSKVKIHGKYPSGTTVASVNISTLSPAEALATLQTSIDAYLEKETTISFNGLTKKFKPTDLGIKISPQDTLATLKTVNAKDKNILDVLFFAEKNEKNISLVADMDENILEKTLNVSFGLNELAPVSATFYFDEKGKLAIKDGKEGLVWDRYALIKELKNSASKLDTVELKIASVQAGPGIKKEDLIGQEEAVKTKLNHQFTLLDPVYSDDWNVKLTDHLDWVLFQERQTLQLPYFNEESESDSQKLIAIEINQEKLDQFVDEKISKWLDRAPEPVKIYQDPEGKVVIEGKGSNGLKIQRLALKQAIELAIENQIKDVPIPVLELRPEISISPELQEMGVKERLTVGHTSYYGSPPNRVHNIKVGSARFNGLLIAPGEVFSFNKYLGPVDAANGYRKELVIKQEGTVPDFGGGICQVSTTMFRAILFAGLDLVERNQHSYAVSYYSQILGHGLDATIFLGGPDLRFKNDTSGHILVQAYIEKDYELYIVLYGTPDGRKVEMEGPYISNHRGAPATVYIDTTDLPPGQKKTAEKAHAGFDALWYRHLTLPSGETVKETISTRYKAMPMKILVGAAAAAPMAQP